MTDGNILQVFTQGRVSRTISDLVELFHTGTFIFNYEALTLYSYNYNKWKFADNLINTHTTFNLNSNVKASLCSHTIMRSCATPDRLDTAL
jgi:hypothetical protein